MHTTRCKLHSKPHKHKMTPSELTMFRLLMVFHEMHDFQVKLAKRLKAKFAMRKNTKSFEEEEFYLIYEALGQKVAMPLALDDFAEE